MHWTDSVFVWTLSCLFKQLANPSMFFKTKISWWLLRHAVQTEAKTKNPGMQLGPNFMQIQMHLTWKLYKTKILISSCKMWLYRKIYRALHCSGQSWPYSVCTSWRSFTNSAESWSDSRSKSRKCCTVYRCDWYIAVYRDATIQRYFCQPVTASLRSNRPHYGLDRPSVRLYVRWVRWQIRLFVYVRKQ